MGRVDDNKDTLEGYAKNEMITSRVTRRVVTVNRAHKGWRSKR